MNIWILILALIFLPIFLILGGLALEWILKWLDRLATSSLIFTVLPEGKKQLARTYISLFIYYLTVSSLIAFMAKNLVITTFAHISFEDWQLYVLGLSLSFVPRAIKLATGVIEKSRFMLLSILTPLTLMALPLLVFQPEAIRLPIEGAYLLPLEALSFATLGDLFIYLSIRFRLVQPEIDLETVGITNLRRNIESERMVDFSNLCILYNLAIKRGRQADAGKILDGLHYGISLAKERQNPDVLIKMLKALPLLDDLTMLDVCANSCLAVLDQDFRTEIIESFDRYLEKNKIRHSDTDRLRLLVGKNSSITEHVMEQLSTIAKHDHEAKDIIKALYQDHDLYVRRAGAVGFLFLSKSAPELFDVELVNFIGQVEEQRAKILAIALLRSIAVIIPEKILATTQTLTSDVFMQARQDALNTLENREMCT